MKDRDIIIENLSTYLGIPFILVKQLDDAHDNDINYPYATYDMGDIRHDTARDFGWTFEPMDSSIEHSYFKQYHRDYTFTFYDMDVDIVENNSDKARLWFDIQARNLLYDNNIAVVKISDTLDLSNYVGEMLYGGSVGLKEKVSMAQFDVSISLWENTIFNDTEYFNEIIMTGKEADSGITFQIRGGE